MIAVPISTNPTPYSLSNKHCEPMKRLHQVSSPLNDKYFREFGKTFEFQGFCALLALLLSLSCVPKLGT